MTIRFSKHHGTGNDFIMIDDRHEAFDLGDRPQIAAMCDRHFGIGADGLILIRHQAPYDFRMIYFNSDGREGSMCGNGARCAVAFCRELGLITDRARFLAYDGEHSATIAANTISVSMADVKGIREIGTDYVLDTGSPHLVRFVADPGKVDVMAEGRTIRDSAPFMQEGINVNFISVTDNIVIIRTYERGVEAETLSCGTGAIAAALVAGYRSEAQGHTSYQVDSRGGRLTVSFRAAPEGQFAGINLAGPASRVFDGVWGH